MSNVRRMEFPSKLYFPVITLILNVIKRFGIRLGTQIIYSIFSTIDLT